MATSEFAAIIGLDWADNAHAVCVLPAGGGPAELSEVKHEPSGIADWVADLRQRFAGQRVAICLELARGGLVYALMHYEFLVLYPINPKQLADYRSALYPGGSKGQINGTGPNGIKLSRRP